MGNVSGCPKCIALRTIFRNILGGNDKIINFLITFYIFHKNGIKIFLMWFINDCLKWPLINHDPLITWKGNPWIIWKAELFKEAPILNWKNVEI